MWHYGTGQLPYQTFTSQHFDVMSPTLSKTSLHGKKCDIIEFVKLLAKHLQQVRELFFCYVFQITTLLVNNPKNAFT